jgi:hypothetical protein
MFEGRKMNRLTGWAYLAGMSVAGVASFLTLLTTVVRDDGHGIGYLMLVMAAAVGSFAAWLRPAGMARTMVGLAGMQLLHAIALATATPIAATAGASLKVMLFGIVFAGLWLASAAFFALAAKRAPGHAVG